jgi:uncharacterized membrane protein YsdA (DUF1294 family)/cold shock CspA family protein
MGASTERLRFAELPTMWIPVKGSYADPYNPYLGRLERQRGQCDMAQFEGKLASWNSERGFGFIKPTFGGKDIFVHIRDLRCKSKAPLIGETIFYDVKQGHDGRARAYNAYVNGAKDTKPRAYASPGILAVLFAAIPFSLSLYIIRTIYYPFVVYSVASLVCFFSYLSDKRKATSGRWRVPESTLHLLELIGGWPGALIAQQTLRHKTRKWSFQFTFWAIVFLHFIAWIDYLFLDQSLFFKVLKFIDGLTRA